jgi:hypothetical protein
MNKDTLEKSLWPNILKGLALVLLTSPLTIVIILKALYALSQTHQMLSGLKNIVVTFYNEFTWTQTIWDYTPTLQFVDIFTFQNFLALTCILTLVYGLGLIARANNDHDRLEKAKKQAEDDNLRDDYKRDL